jgi:hypothetical protein
MQCQTMNDVEETLNRVLAGVNLAHSGRTYWEQNGCLILDRFIPKTIVNPCLTEGELLRKNIYRNYVPGHKQGGRLPGSGDGAPRNLGFTLYAPRHADVHLHPQEPEENARHARRLM